MSPALFAATGTCTGDLLRLAQCPPHSVGQIPINSKLHTIMAKAHQNKTPQLNNLTMVDKRNAIPKLERRIKDLNSIDLNAIRKKSDPVPEAVKEKVDLTLQDIYGYDSVEYSRYSVGTFCRVRMITGYIPTLKEVVAGYKDGIERVVINLETLKGILEEQVADAAQEPGHGLTSDDLCDGARRIFVVHGLDNEMKATVARFIKQLDFEPIILHEQASSGDTIIEKLERNSDVSYAIVLLSPDDVGAVESKKDELQYRARQNVVLELGYFIGKLGRSHVFTLVRKQVEFPSDFQGVVYVPFDGEDWKLRLIKELKHLGFEVDANKAI